MNRTKHAADQTDQIAKQFKEKFGKNFDIVTALIRERKGETFWTVTVKPKNAGHFLIGYSYKIGGHVHKHEFPLIVGLKSARQTLVPLNSDASIFLPMGRVGDEFVLPIQIKEAFTDFTFFDQTSLFKSESDLFARFQPPPDKDWNDKKDKGDKDKKNSHFQTSSQQTDFLPKGLWFQRFKLKNKKTKGPAVPELLAGEQSLMQVYQVFYYFLQLEATAPGDFNLSLGLDKDEFLQPLRVRDENAIIKKMIPLEFWADTSDESNSPTMHQYQVETLTIRKGDIINLKFAAAGPMPPFEDPVPRLTRHPFNPSKKEKPGHYDEWLK